MKPLKLKAAFALGEEKLPDNLQWMPPGTHSICASQDGAPFEATVYTSEDLVKLLDEKLSSMIKEAEEGKASAPVIDFNHEGGDAAAWPTHFYWGGDDPKSGGIRLAVEWTSKGKEAVAGKVYRYFSPTFFYSLEKGIYNICRDLGGLTNNPAFQSIAKIAASNTQLTEKNTYRMEEVKTLLLAAGLIGPEASEEEVLNAIASLIQYKKDSDEKVTEIEARFNKLVEEKAVATVEAAMATKQIDARLKPLLIKGMIADEKNTAIILESLPKKRIESENTRLAKILASFGVDSVQTPAVSHAQSVQETRSSLSEKWGSAVSNKRGL